MVTIKDIRKLGREIARKFNPRQIVLFGSYARGKPTPDSDVDLLVVLPFKGDPVDKSVEIRLNIHPPFPVDLLVRTPKKVSQRLKMGDSFMENILKNGKVLYEASHA